jgi:hypothetical protein
MDKEDLIKRVYSQLVSLRQNLQDTHPNNVVEWDEVNLYIGLLDKLESAGFDVEDFKIPSQVLSDEVVETNYLTHETAKSGRSNVRFGLFKTKLDALLTYFQLGEKKTKIGFRDPDSE